MIGFLYRCIESARGGYMIVCLHKLALRSSSVWGDLSIGHLIIKSFQNSPSACNPAADKAGSARYPKKKHRSAFLVFSNFIRRLGFFHDSRFLVVSRENIGSFCSLSSWGPRTHLCGVLGQEAKWSGFHGNYYMKRQPKMFPNWPKCSRIGNNCSRLFFS